VDVEKAKGFLMGPSDECLVNATIWFFVYNNRTLFICNAWSWKGKKENLKNWHTWEWESTSLPNQPLS